MWNILLDQGNVAHFESEPYDAYNDLCVKKGENHWKNVPVFLKILSGLEKSETQNGEYLL